MMDHLSQDDARLLRATVAALRDLGDLDENQERHLAAFDGMLDKYRPLTPRQRDYVKGVAQRLEVDVEAPLLAKDVPVGEKLRTPVPAVLLMPLPKRPPGRK
ncbi:MAG TPA: hypothetical protein VNV25_25455 [Gemmatimonadaceae bacterium]|nr:hypothetical protein [Gemmatimonadaceae bacterium]